MSIQTLHSKQSKSTLILVCYTCIYPIVIMNYVIEYVTSERTKKIGPDIDIQLQLFDTLVL